MSQHIHIYALHHIIPNVFMSATQSIFNCFYSHTTINILMPKHLHSSAYQFLIIEKHNRQQEMSRGILPFFQLLLHNLELFSLVELFLRPPYLCITQLNQAHSFKAIYQLYLDLPAVLISFILIYQLYLSFHRNTYIWFVQKTP